MILFKGRSSLKQFNPKKSIKRGFKLWCRADKQRWVSSLLGLLQYEITKLIACEPEKKANDYNHVKRLSLKRFKLSPETFQKIFLTTIVHRKTLGRILFTNYAHILKNGKETEKLKDLNINEQVKKGISATTQEHFIDDWFNVISPEELADKLDAYENVRKGIKMLPSSANDGMTSKSDSQNSSDREFMPIDEQNNFRNFPINPPNFNDSYRRSHRNPDLNPKIKFKCYKCLEFGSHLARDCPKPKTISTCDKCKIKGHNRKYYTTLESQSSLTVTHQKLLNQSSAFLKEIFINDCDQGIEFK
ncbi:CCHC-type domain-containing protein [Trichonephila clavipes]|nr:CCHC-type domain-containing protein [Trichonephila clavipes]